MPPMSKVDLFAAIRLTNNTVRGDAGGIVLSDETGPVATNSVTGNSVQDNPFGPPNVDEDVQSFHKLTSHVQGRVWAALSTTSPTPRPCSRRPSRRRHW